ncbi:MAG: aminotransferase class III-fold pyridoxal phosphate-dependent enzyme [Syntrophomonas sp.]
MSFPRKDLLNPTLARVLETFKLDKIYMRGEGSYLWDADGVRYLDFIAQYGSVPFGYNPDFIWEKLSEVREKGWPSLVQPSLPPEALRLAEKLAEITPGDLCYSTFCQSGTEAVEASIKLARSATSKHIIISTNNSFHGKTLGSLSATGKRSYQTPFYAPAPGFIKVPYNDVAALQQAIALNADNIAGFIVEPVQGEGGIVVAEPGYLKAVQKLCNENGIVFIVDEIQTGLGRSGKMFACEYENVEPDVLLLAKALGGGMLPMAVCISSPRVWNDEFGMLHSSTFANNNVTCAVGSAVLQKLLENESHLVKDVALKGDYLLEKVHQLAKTYPQVIKEVRGRGLMVGIEFYCMEDCGSYDMAYLTDQAGFTALLAGFLLNVFHIRLAPFLNNSMTLRLEPPLTITYEEIDYVITALDDVCKILTYRDYAKLYKFLLGNNSRPEKLVDYRLVTRNIKPSILQEGEKPARKFAFVIHYPAPEDVVLNNPSFQDFSRNELYDFMKWESRIEDPGVVCHMPAIRSGNGTLVEGWLIGVPLGGREIMGMPAGDAAAMVAKAVDLGRELGAEIVGLGALTSVVTRGGRSVMGRDVAITSGNSFTTLMAMQGLLLGAQKMHIKKEEARAAVVGATGSIGRACALLISEQVENIVLLGNSNHVISSRNRLNSLVQDIMNSARTRMNSGQLTGLSGWLNRVIDLLQHKNTNQAGEHLKAIYDSDLDLNYLTELCAYLGLPCPLSISIDIDKSLAGCNMIIAASNSPEYLIFPEHLRPGAVVCDVARPADVSPLVYEHRDDVLILEGGLVQYPDQIAFGPNLGYRDGVSLGCLSETVLLAMEGDCQDYSIGVKLPLENIHYLRELGQKHGFTLAGLRMGNREITEEEIERIYLNSLRINNVEGAS